MHCKYCGSSNTREEVMLTGVRYSKLICVDRDRFLGWGKKPVNIAKEQEIVTQIIQLSSVDLTEWESNFISSIRQTFAEKAKLSLKQAEILSAIVARRLS